MDCFGKKSKKHYYCCIKLLDVSELSLDVKKSTLGQALLDHVFKHLNILETDYFGLRYLDRENQTHWLEASTTVYKQIKTGAPYTVYFGVKFYVEDPCKLKEEITRYQFFLQIKQDMLQGRLPCTFNVAAELGAYAVQSELGDYDSKRYTFGYISEFRFVPDQTEELENRIMEIHNTLKGQIPSVAEMKFLERAKWLEMYGVDLHAVKGQDNSDYFLGLTPTGVVIYRNKNKVAHYFWPRISKVNFIGTEFFFKVIGKDNLESQYSFDVGTRFGSEHLWKCCVEQHAFFRLPHLVDTTLRADFNKKLSLSGNSSKYRQSGRTQKEALEASGQLVRAEPQVVRTPSRRYTRRSEANLNVNQSKVMATAPNGSATVLLPHNTSQGQVSLARSPAAAGPAHSQSGVAPSSVTVKSLPWDADRPAGLYTPAGGSPVSQQRSSSGHRRRSKSRDSYKKDDDADSLYRRQRRRDGSESEGDNSLYNHTYSKHRSRRKSRSRGGESSGSESEHSHRRQRESRRRRRRSSDRMVDSAEQWREVQRMQQGDNGSVKSSSSSRRWKLEREKPEDREARRSLSKHLDFHLIEPPTDPSAIPYTEVKTDGIPVRITASPFSRRRRRSRSRERRNSQGSEVSGMSSRVKAEPMQYAQDHYIPPYLDQYQGQAPPPHSYSSPNRDGQTQFPWQQEQHHQYQQQQQQEVGSPQRQPLVDNGMYYVHQRSEADGGNLTGLANNGATVVHLGPNAKPLYMTTPVYQPTENVAREQPPPPHGFVQRRGPHPINASDLPISASGINGSHSRPDLGINQNNGNSITRNGAEGEVVNGVGHNTQLPPLYRPGASSKQTAGVTNLRGTADGKTAFQPPLQKMEGPGTATQDHNTNNNNRRPETARQTLLDGYPHTPSKGYRQTPYSPSDDYRPATTTASGQHLGSLYNHQPIYRAPSNPRPQPTDGPKTRQTLSTNYGVQQAPPAQRNHQKDPFRQGQMVIQYLTAREDMMYGNQDQTQKDSGDDQKFHRQSTITSEELNFISTSPGKNHNIFTEL